MVVERFPERGDRPLPPPRAIVLQALLERCDRRAHVGEGLGTMVVQSLEHRHRLRLALHADEIDLSTPDVVLQLLEGELAEQDVDPIVLRRALEPRRQIHRVADDRVLHPLERADVAGDELAGVDPDADADLGRARAPRSAFSWRRAVIISVATSTALPAPRTWVKGTPNTAMIASPMYLSRIPPWLKTTSTMSVKYSFSIETVPRAPSVSAMVVKLRMSENRTEAMWLDPPRPSSSSASTRSTSSLVM